VTYLVVLSSASSKKEARRLAAVLLKERLAACVNIVSSVESHYWWKGKKENSREALLFIKAKTGAFAGIEKTLRARHSYSVPEIIAIPISKGSRPYLAWLNRVVGK